YGGWSATARAVRLAELCVRLSRNATAMAAIMLGMAEAYAPNHRDLAILQVRVHGGTGRVLGDLSLAGLAPGGEGAIPRVSPSSLAAPATPEEAAIAALLMPRRTAAPAKSRSN